MLCIGRMLTLACCLLLLGGVMTCAYLLSSRNPVVIVSTPLGNITFDPTGPETDVIGYKNAPDPARLN